MEAAVALEAAVVLKATAALEATVTFGAGAFDATDALAPFTGWTTSLATAGDAEVGTALAAVVFISALTAVVLLASRVVGFTAVFGTAVFATITFSPAGFAAARDFTVSATGAGFVAVTSLVAAIGLVAADVRPAVA